MGGQIYWVDPRIISDPSTTFKLKYLLAGSSLLTQKLPQDTHAIGNNNKQDGAVSDGLMEADLANGSVVNMNLF